MAPMTRTHRLLIAAVCTLSSATASQAQRALLPLDDIAYTYIDALQMRGALRTLPTLERPYSVGAVRAAVAAARGSLHDAGSARWLDAILAAADKYAPGVTTSDSGVFVAGIAGYAVAQSSGNRDLMQSDRVTTFAPGFTVRALLSSGPFTVAMRTIADRQMRVDPEFTGRRDRALSARAEDAYLAVASRWATLEAGRVGRSWALPGQLGLTVSNGAYTYDHLYLRLGTDRVHLASIVARLDDEQVDFSSDTLASRYFSAHRLAFSTRSLEFGVSESVVYGGIGRGFTPMLSNPAAPVFLTQYSDGQQVNVAFGADLLWHASNGMRLGGQVHLDDFQIDRCQYCGEPPGVAGAVSLDGVPMPGGARGFAAYTRVTALTYRAPDRFERYTSRTVGLGQRNSDFDEIRAGIDVGPVLPAPVRAYIAYRRQGAGDYREPYPALAARSTWPTIFEGVVVRTLRVAASTAVRLGDAIEVSADAGVNHVGNDLRHPGATVTRFDGRLRVAIEPTRGRLRVPLF